MEKPNREKKALISEKSGLELKPSGVSVPSPTSRLALRGFAYNFVERERALGRIRDARVFLICAVDSLSLEVVARVFVLTRRGFALSYGSPASCDIIWTSVSRLISLIAKLRSNKLVL